MSDLGMTERGPMREENGLAIVLGMAKSGVDSERTGRVGVFPAGASAAGQRAAKYLLALDVVIMLGLIGFGLGNLLAGAWRPPKIAPIWVVVVVLVAAGLPVVLRRFWPVAAFRGGLVAGVVAVLLGGQWAVALDIGLALYVVVAEQPRRRGILNLALALAVTLLAPLVSVGPDTLGQIGFSWAVLIACAATGIAVQERRGRVESNILRRERQAVADERLRIAWELHDIVAHSMSLITVKAAVANHVVGQHPEEAREALRVIEAASRDGLAELRRMLGVLRSEDEPTGDLAPAPAVGDLAGLVERAASAGVTMSLDVRGTDALPDAIGLTVYRIVQEAVTNVVKHAAPANCAVTVEVADGQVRVEVADDGAAREPREAGAAPGHGLIGMRERVMTYAGNFEAGPRPGGGFTVTARLPFKPATAGAPEVISETIDDGGDEDQPRERGADGPVSGAGADSTVDGAVSPASSPANEAGTAGGAVCLVGSAVSPADGAGDTGAIASVGEASVGEGGLSEASGVVASGTDASVAEASGTQAGGAVAGGAEAGASEADLSRAVGDAGLHGAAGCAGLSDAGLSDAGLNDAGLNDAGLSDAGLNDAGLSGAGGVEAGGLERG
ncbi:MAG TPA: sensor histidine kinase [Pseudonocardiaceae bacterium]